jgi:hypothetical protein
VDGGIVRHVSIVVADEYLTAEVAIVFGPPLIYGSGNPRDVVEREVFADYSAPAVAAELDRQVFIVGEPLMAPGRHQCVAYKMPWTSFFRVS